MAVLFLRDGGAEYSGGELRNCCTLAIYHPRTRIATIAMVPTTAPATIPPTGTDLQAVQLGDYFISDRSLY